MRRLVMVACMVLSAAACTASGSTPSPTATPLPVASHACGGYHLMLSIVGQSDAEVRLNGNLVTTVRPGQTTDIDQHIQGLRGQAYVPPMPWDVAVTRVSDGTVLLTIHLTDDGTDGRFFQVGDVPAAGASGVAYVCGRLPV